jgi:hypothetical protein
MQRSLVVTHESTTKEFLIAHKRHQESSLKVVGSIRSWGRQFTKVSVLDGILCFGEGWGKVTRFSALFSRLEIDSCIIVHKKESP